MSFYEREPPLTEKELRIVRGMIDDHEYRRIHEIERTEFWTNTKVGFAVLGGIMTLALQFFTVLALLTK